PGLGPDDQRLRPQDREGPAAARSPADPVGRPGDRVRGPGRAHVPGRPGVGRPDAHDRAHVRRGRTVTIVPDSVRRAFADARSIRFVTGGGISADPGLPVYRGIGGLYDKPTEEGLPIEEILSGDTLRDDPALCWKYMGEIERACRGALPNAAHRAIARLEGR